MLVRGLGGRRSLGGPSDMVTYDGRFNADRTYYLRCKKRGGKGVEWIAFNSPTAYKQLPLTLRLVVSIQSTNCLLFDSEEMLTSRTTRVLARKGQSPERTTMPNLGPDEDKTEV
jgi:hypothetical protein